MKLYRFTASNTQKAILEATETLGANALVYSTRKIPGGVEILAGLPFGTEEIIEEQTPEKPMASIQKLKVQVKAKSKSKQKNREIKEISVMKEAPEVKKEILKEIIPEIVKNKSKEGIIREKIPDVISIKEKAPDIRAIENLKLQIESMNENIQALSENVTLLQQMLLNSLSGGESFLWDFLKKLKNNFVSFLKIRVYITRATN